VKRWVAGLVAACVLLAPVQPALAQREPPTEKAAEAKPAPAEKKPEAEPEPEHVRVIDQTGYTLEGGAVRLGVFKLQVGLFDFLTVGTYTLPWAVLAATVHAKLRLVEAGPFALSVQAGFAYFDSRRLQWLNDEIGSAVVTVLPLEAQLSYRPVDALSLSFGAAYTEVAVDGELSIEAYNGAGRGAADNAQLTGNAELRLNSVFALIVELRWLMLQRVAANANATLRPDAFTVVVVHGGAAARDFEVRDAFSVVPSLLITLGVFNLRLGVGYGNYNIPLVNFVVPERTLIPEADLYFLF
jgi:hypothetical protein